MAEARKPFKAPPVPRAVLRHDCPVCRGTRLSYLFVSQGYPVSQCRDCQLLFRNPRPSDDVLSGIYSADYFLGEPTEQGRERVAAMKRATARLYLSRLAAYRHVQGGRLLDLGCGTGELLVEAERAGFDVAGQEISPDAVREANARLGHAAVRHGSLERLQWAPGSFDVCVLADVLEHVPEPLELLEQVRELLKPGGTILIVTPSLTSWSARLLRRNWMEFKLEHLTFFSPTTLENALAKAGFREVRTEPNYKVLTAEYVYQHFQRFRVPVVSRALGLGYRILPRVARERRVQMVASGVLALARVGPTTERPRLSIIVPAYNERATFATVMDGLLSKQLEGLDREIIVVESNSTDGTREEALRYREHPEVTVVLEDEPKGKGHAVRRGLAQARGDYVLIQDADLEYDLNDYDALLEPLLTHQAAFVLGTRHGGNWKMRQFIHNPGQALVMNLGHVFFTFLVNVLLGQRLKDPFTMYKVFRRDCIHDVKFEQNRFGFDFELVIKLIRKGYTPLEIPVNYRSRSFREGKKVRMIRDPLEWLWVAFKYRLAPTRSWRKSE